jgi:hypothetical protein
MISTWTVLFSSQWKKCIALLYLLLSVYQRSSLVLYVPGISSWYRRMAQYVHFFHSFCDFDHDEFNLFNPSSSVSVRIVNGRLYVFLKKTILAWRLDLNWDFFFGPY